MARPRRLLMLNWRDPGHPRAGGAELLTLRILERLAASWEVEWFSAAYDGASPEEIKGDIRYVRDGSQATVHMAAAARYFRASGFDVIVDQINTIPFMSPLYSTAKTVAFIHQLAREVWEYEMPGVIGKVGRALEPYYLAPYRTVPVITVSNSSKQSLRDIGFSGRIHVISECVDECADAHRPVKTEPRDVLYLGRVTPSKRVEDCIVAACHLRDEGWNGRLFIAGSEPNSQYLKSLKELASRHSAPVVFLGRVSDLERSNIMRSASALWMTSVREGWGLVVTEAARHWTPAVVYRVPGLVDSVCDGETGFVTETSPAALARATAVLFSDKFDAVSERARTVASELTWDRSAREFESALLSELR